nr:acyl-CoA dehydrogenase [Desulfobacterales bacterium]
MDFTLTDEQRMFKESVRKFAEKEIAPIIDEAEDKEAFPVEIIRKMGKLGYLGISGPPEYGGGGLGKIEECLFMEEIARVSVSVAAVWVVQGGIPPSILWSFGSEEQKEKYLIPTLKGEKIVSLGVTEVNAGNEVKAIQTTAKRDGDYYIINGSKTFNTIGTISDYIILLAYVDKSKGIDGMNLFIVDRGTQGYTFTKQRKEANKAAESADAYFDDCRIPIKNLIGKEGEGFRKIMERFNVERILVSARAVGVAQAAYEAAVKYAGERIQFGKPIGEFQSIAFKLADMEANIQAARLLTYYAAWLWDQGNMCIKEVSSAKLFSTEMAAKVTEEALHIHGGWGLVKGEFPVWRYFRDARVAPVTVGSSEIQRRIIAKELGFRV